MGIRVESLLPVAIGILPLDERAWGMAESLGNHRDWLQRLRVPRVHGAGHCRGLHTQSERGAWILCAFMCMHGWGAQLLHHGRGAEAEIMTAEAITPSPLLGSTMPCSQALAPASTCLWISTEGRDTPLNHRGIFHR